MDKIYIIDAVNYLFRSYYAIGPMTNKKGVSTSALFGFIRSVRKLIKDFSPKHLVAVFDGPDNKKGRQELFQEYKAHRKKAPDDLYPQITLAQEYCERANIPILCVNGVEADDTMASIAIWADKKNMQAFICTSDKDLCQLIHDNILVLNTFKGNLIIDKKKVFEIYGVNPDQMGDYLSITGDASDNIPGIEGFGPKTATELLQKFGSLDAILAHPEQIESQKKRETLLKQKEQALLSKKLVTLDLNVEIPQNKDFYLLKDPNADKLHDFYLEMNFMSLLSEAIEETSKKKEPEKTGQEEKVEYHLVNQEKTLEDLITKLLAQKEISLDVETSHLDFMMARLVGIGLSHKKGDAYYIPLNGNIPQAIVLKQIKRLVENDTVSIFGHNIKYDLHILRNYGISPQNICFDTLVGSYLLNPENRRHNLDDLTLAKFSKNKIPIADLIGSGKKQLSMEDVPLEKICAYCCEDVDYTLRLKELFQQEIKKQNLEKVFYEIELPLITILFEMENAGIFIDTEIFAKLNKEFSHDLHLIEEEIYKEVGGRFNINSPKQLSEVLYVDLGLALPGKKTTSTAADILEKLAKNSPLVSNILKYRTLQKLLSTYVDALPKQINPKTLRIHSTFNQSIVATGRLSSQNPNLQNIPVKSPEGKKIREGFVPQKNDCSYLSLDYSQIELRLLAHFSEDPNLLQAFNDNQDIHTQTAASIFNVSLNEVTSFMRSTAKAVNFGIIYGQGAYGLSEQLNIPMKDAKRFIDSYFARFSSVPKYLEKIKKEAEVNGYAETLVGRKRPIPDLNSPNPMIRSAAQRLAVNTPMQGTAADIIKMAMINIDKLLKKGAFKGFLILQVHDELIFEAPDTELDTLKELAKKEMEGVVSLKVPLIVDINIGKNWGKC